MNKDLIDFIKLCLVDGVISKKEREVIFRKSKELGVPRDECEIILEGLSVVSVSKENSVVVKNEEKEINNKSISNEEKYSILTHDTKLVSSYINSLHFLDDRLSYCMKNLKDDSKDFYKWYSKLRGSKIKKKNIIYKGKLLGEGFFIDGFPELSDSRKGEIPFLGVSKTYSNITLGDGTILSLDEFYTLFLTETKIKKSDFLGIRNTLDGFKLYTTKYLYPVSYSEGGFFTKGGYKVDEKNKINLSKIDLFKDNDRQNLLPFLFTYYTNPSSKFLIIDCIEKFKFNYNFTDLSTELSSVKSDDLDVIIRVNNSLVNLKTDLDNFCDDLIRLENTSELKSFLRIIGSLNHNNHEYKILKSVFVFVEKLVTKIKLISSVLFLRNKLIYYSKTNNNLKFKETEVKLDNLGILMNYFESTSIKELQKVSDVISNEMKVLNKTLESLNNEIIENLDSINVSNNKINDNIKLGNLISFISGYQSYKINLNTKS